MKKFYAALSILVMFFLLTVPADARAPDPFVPPDLDNLVVFGDSLSDSGNVFAFSGGTDPISSTYWQGRVSNGPVWSDNVADLMETENDYLLANFNPFVPGVPITFTTPMFFNNAFAGATTDATPPNFLSQVGSWVISDVQVPTQTLVVVWIGANNLLGLPGDPNSAIADAVADISAGLVTLEGLGATHIAVCNLPDLGSTPMYLGTDNEAEAREITQGFNTALDEAVQIFIAANEDVKIYEIDIYAMFAEALANPARFGVTNVITAALAMGETFETADDYLFWDDIHPTRQAHKQIAALIYGNVFISSTAGADFIATDGITGDVIGISCSNGVISSIAFVDLYATDELNRPAYMPYGLMDIAVNLDQAVVTACIVIDLPDALPAEFSCYKYIGGEWVDFAEVYESSGGAQGARISANRQQVTFLIADGGEYDADGAANGVVVDPVGPGAPNIWSLTTDEVGNLIKEHGGDDCFIQSAQTQIANLWPFALLAGLFIFGMTLRAKLSR